MQLRITLKKKEIASMEYSKKFIQVTAEQKYLGWARSIITHNLIEYATNNPIQRDIAFFAIKYIISDSYTDKEIGEMFGCSNQMVNRHLKTAQIEIIHSSRRLQNSNELSR